MYNTSCAGEELVEWLLDVLQARITTYVSNKQRVKSDIRQVQQILVDGG